MTLPDRIRRALLRWDRLLVIASVALPIAVTSLLGFLWLGQQGYLLYFIGVAGLFGGTVTLLRWLARRRRRAPVTVGDLAADMAVSANPDWLPQEAAAFDRARRKIEATTASAQPWEALPDVALGIVDEVAKGFGSRTALDFTLPEALLLIERSVTRYRARLRAHVPFADTVSLQTLHWLWRNRGNLSTVSKAGWYGYRALRVMLNPAVGIAREVELIVAGGNSDWLSDQMMGVLQAILLEEVAYSAVELYSGRLRFSDAELLAIELEQTEADTARMAEADTPLRVVFVGQISAGKSTLINALLGADRAETDMAPTTPGLVTYEAEIGGMPCHWIDSQGADGSAGSVEALLAELREADLIVWVLRANRPGRAADLALLERFEASFAAEPARRRPEVIAVASCIDQLAPGWPYPENRLPAEVQQVFAGAVAAIAGDMGGLKPLPVCAVSPEWNIEPLRAEMEAGLGHALLVQRNRRRMAAGRGGRSVKEAARSTRGVLQGAGRIGSRLARRAFTSSKTPPE